MKFKQIMTVSLLSLAFYTLSVDAAASGISEGVRVAVGPVLVRSVSDDFIVRSDGRKEMARFLFAYEKPTERFWENRKCASPILFAVVRSSTKNSRYLMRKVKEHFDEQDPLSTERRFRLVGKCLTLPSSDITYIDILDVKPVIYTR